MKLLSSALFLALATCSYGCLYIAKIRGSGGQGSICGLVTLRYVHYKGTEVCVKVEGFPKHAYRAMHVHRNSMPNNYECGQAGGHFLGCEDSHHGCPGQNGTHSGDLGNVQFDANGCANFCFFSKTISLDKTCETGYVGEASIVFHEEHDRCRAPGDDGATGSAGGRSACGNIEQVCECHATYCPPCNQLRK